MKIEEYNSHFPRSIPRLNTEIHRIAERSRNIPRLNTEIHRIAERSRNITLGNYD
jgi:hypothetical protein